MKTTALLMLPLLLVAGCGVESHQAPVSSLAPASPGASNHEPQPANSLPPGTAVDSKLTSPSGNVGNTRVGPATAPYGRPRY